MPPKTGRGPRKSSWRWRGVGHEVFFDRESLPAGADYHARIKASVDDAQQFVFLISPDAVDTGGYTLTGMGYARSRWPHPKGYVLPMLLRPTPFATIPAYLKSVTVLEPGGNVAAEVVAAVARLADGSASPGLRKYALIGAVGQDAGGLQGPDARRRLHLGQHRDRRAA